MLGLADELLRRGESDEAVQILDLLARDPDVTIRNEARFRRSRLLESRGSNREAAVLLRRILDEKPDAVAVRLQLAQLLDRMGDKDAAWRQVRAVHAAGLPPDVARIVTRYSEALHSQRPAGASFQIAIAPDSNISRATRSDTLGTVLGDFRVDDGSKARSGTGLSLQGQAFRRFPIPGDDSLLVRASTSLDLYRKSRFNDVIADVAAGPELHWGRSRFTLEAGAAQRWYGWRLFERSVRLGGSWTRPFGQRSQLRLSAFGALIDNRSNELEDGNVYSGQASLEHALSPTMGVALTVGADRRALKDPGYSTTGWRLSFVGWRDIGRATLSIEGEYSRRKADARLALFPEARSDHFARFTIGTMFRQLTFRGFAPITRIVYERNRSTIEFYDYRRTRTEFGIVRAF